ncbi:MAG: hypothetical protein Q8Q09_09945 [Deltaproteobacteria bacterium]|nr:hypothetical protein [Deltaproteobacteria bacterium]
MSGPTFDAAKAQITLADSRLVFHCHHYNVSLQRTLQDALGERAVAIQREAACETARVMLTRLYAEEALTDFSARVARASQIFSDAGFGRADVSAFTPLGATLTLTTSHYAIGWIAKFGPSSEPVDHFAAGYFRGALIAAAGLNPERVSLEVVQDAGAGEGMLTVVRYEVR